MKLNRSLGSFSLLLTAVGGIIGSGWLFGPLYTAQLAGPAAVISWVMGGLLMIIIALTFAELTSTFPLAGGMVRFAHFSHGPLVSFTTGWMVWLSSVAVAPVETVAIVQYADIYIHGLTKTINGVHVLSHTGFIAASLLMLLMCVMNVHGAKFFARTSNAIVILKIIIPLLVGLVLVSAHFHLGNFYVHGFTPFGWHGVFSALPLGGVVFSFIGYNAAIQMAGEAKNPQSAIPFAIIGSLIICICLYVLLQIAFIGALPLSTIINGWSVVHLEGASGPFAGLLASIGIMWLVIVIYADALISPFGTAFIYTTSTARINYGLSKIHFFPNYFAKLTRWGVPMRAIMFNYFVGLLLFLPFPSWQGLVGFIVSCFVISFIIGPIALLGLRKRLPDHERPFRLPLPVFMCVSAFYICNLLILWAGWQTVSKLLVAMLIGLGFYIIHSYWEGNKIWQQERANFYWLIPYIVILGSISYFSSFGGKNLIPFGLDFVIIAILSLFVFYFAMRAIKPVSEQDWLILKSFSQD